MRLTTALNLELLHPAAIHRLPDINVPLGVERHRVRMHEFPHLVARAAETPEHLPTGAVYDIYLLIYLIDYVHELLAWNAGKFDGRARSHQHRFPPRSDSRRGNRSPHLESERNVFLKIAHGVEYLNPIHPPI